MTNAALVTQEIVQLNTQYEQNTSRENRKPRAIYEPSRLRKDKVVIPRFDDEDEEELPNTKPESQQPKPTNPGESLVVGLLCLLAFSAFFDILIQLGSGSALIFIPIIMHLVFLRLLYVVNFKLSLAPESPANLNGLINTITAYLCMWLVVDILVASLGGSFFSVGISLFVTIVSLIIFPNLLRRINPLTTKK